MRIIILILSVFYPCTLWADSSAFGSHADDKSIRYLSYVFGEMGTLPVGSDVTNPVFSQLMTKFNFIIVILCAIIIAYTALTGTMRSAQEGSPLGKKYGSIGTPVRSLFGLFLLLPWKSGYCIIQMVVMWFVLQGIGAANGVWDTVVDHYKEGNPINYTMGTNSDIDNLMAEEAKKQGWMYAGNYYHELVKRANSQDTDDSTSNYNDKTIIMDPDGDFGNWVDKMIPGTLRDIIRILDYVTVPTQIFIDFMAMLLDPPDEIPGLGSLGIMKFAKKVLRPIVRVITEFFLDKILFFVGGKGFFEILLEALCSVLFFTTASIYTIMNTAIESVQSFFNAMNLLSEIAQLPSTIENKITNTDRDILINLSFVGNWLTAGAENILFGTLIAIGLFFASTGMGSAFSPVPHAAKGVLGVVIPIVFAAITLLWILGISLSIYIPMIPYFVFLFATIGWFLLVIEAIIAAPLIAMIFVVPSEDEVGKAGNALVILLGLILRPVLMILGFIMAAKLLNVAVNLLTQGFTTVVDIRGFILSPKEYGMFGGFAVIFLYVGLVTSIVNQCFSLIYKIPDKLLRWMGGSPEDQGDISQKMGEVSGSAQSAGAMGQAGLKKIGAKVGKKFKPEDK